MEAKVEISYGTIILDSIYLHSLYLFRSKERRKRKEGESQAMGATTQIRGPATPDRYADRHRSMLQPPNKGNRLTTFWFTHVFQHLCPLSAILYSPYMPCHHHMATTLRARDKLCSGGDESGQLVNIDCQLHSSLAAREI